MSKILEDNVNYKCRKCGSRASVRVTYAKLLLCREHFLEYIENRVLNTMKRYGILKDTRRILVALSGGKDSLSLLHILSKIKDKTELEEIIGIHIDLGLGEYSLESINTVKKTCHDTGTNCIILPIKELMDHNLPELVELTRRPPCSLCGLIKRYILNLTAIELGVDAVALGHHMDDVLVFIIKDFLFQDNIDMAKMIPVTKGIQGLLAKKIKLLYEIYEDDLSTYAYLAGIKTTKTPCPYKYQDPFKNSIRKMMDELENYAPGFKISVARRLAKNLEKTPILEEIQPCRYCGMPSRNGICSICSLTMKIHGEPIGPKIKVKIKNKLQQGILNS
ncbi:MAG: ATP-binding protein [Desulfurococcaceae archaeon]